MALGQRGTTFGAATPLGVVFPGVLAQLVQSATLTRWRSLVRAQYASLPEDIDKEAIRHVWPLFCLAVSCDSLRLRLNYPQSAVTAVTSPRAAPVANFLEG